MLLVALTLGAGVACSVMVVAPPRLTGGIALAGSLLVDRAALPEAPAARAAQTEASEASTAPPATSAPTTTVPSTTQPTTTTRPTSTSAGPAATVAAQRQRVVDLVNAERAGAGCRPLAVDQRLVAAAQAHSTDMASNDYFSHTSLDGRTFADRILAAGYPRPAAENIAKGQRSADEVMRAWMRSKGHRANILDCGLTTIGVGLDTRGWYWTQDFGR